jgi:hypothetical protein
MLYGQSPIALGAFQEKRIPFCYSTPIITPDALMIAYAFFPTLSLRSSHDFFVMIDVISRPGATSTVNSAFTGPISTDFTLPFKTLRALSFISFLLSFGWTDPKNLMHYKVSTGKMQNVCRDVQPIVSAFLLPSPKKQRL